jgi:acyl carrier protein
MTNQELRAKVLECLRRVAPEADLSTLAGNADLRETLDIDSMDFNKFVLGLYEALKVDVPEKDYPKLFTLDGCLKELGARLAAVSGAAP